MMKAKWSFEHRENDNIDYEFRNQLAAMTAEEKEQFLKECEGLAARQIQEEKSLPEKPEMRVRFIGNEPEVWLRKGKIYRAYRSPVTGGYYVIDRSGEIHLYSAEDFEIVDEY